VTPSCGGRCNAETCASGVDREGQQLAPPEPQTISLASITSFLWPGSAGSYLPGSLRHSITGTCGALKLAMLT
jgi:hypothetical protein